MNEIIDFLRELNIYTVIIRIFLTLLLGGLIGYERQRNGHAAGFRTHILVCLGAAMTVMTGIFATYTLGYNSDPLRVGAQVISGIGFIGAGAIMMTDKKNIKGLTTAAGLWSTAAIGLSAGCGFYEGAIICTAVILIVMSSFKSIDRALFRKKPVINLYIEIEGALNVNSVLNELIMKKIDASSVNIRSAMSECKENIGIECTVVCKSKEKAGALLSEVCSCAHVAFAVENDN